RRLKARFVPAIAPQISPVSALGWPHDAGGEIAFLAQLRRCGRHGRTGVVRLPAERRALGVRTRSRRDDSLRIHFASPLSWRTERRGARAEDCQLSAPHPRQAWRGGGFFLPG